MPILIPFDKPKNNRNKIMISLLGIKVRKLVTPITSAIMREVFLVKKRRKYRDRKAPTNAPIVTMTDIKPVSAVSSSLGISL